MAEARRITGPHLLLPTTGAALELGPEQDPDAVAARVRLAAERLGWPVHTAIRRHRGGSTLAMQAPPDVLYTACAVMEWAVAEDPEAAWALVEEEHAEEANPRLLALLEHAPGPSFSDDDYGFTLGLGRHSHTWPLDSLPEIGSLTPAAGIPFVFITGTNGKTTTTRMLTRIAMAAGHRPGWTSSDAYGVGADIVEHGDWTGPGAARAVLRHPEVDFACLETARGGLLRRGLVVGGADVAVVTNVSSDHLGEWGVYDVADMAEAKLGVVAGLAEGGILIANAGNAVLRAAVPDALRKRPDVQVRWFADGPVEGVRLDATATEDRLQLGDLHVPLATIPLTFGGTARHNVENALAAALAASAMGLTDAAIRDGLTELRPSVSESRGRMNCFDLPNGARVVVDFAHNPEGIRQVGRATAAWDASRRFLLLGQAGDRTDEDLTELAHQVAAMHPDGVILKEMHRYLRGRPEGEVIGILKQSLLASGYPESRILTAPTELDGARWMVDNARSGDLMLMLVQADLNGALSLLAQRGATEV